MARLAARAGGRPFAHLMRKARIAGAFSSRARSTKHPCGICHTGCWTNAASVNTSASLRMLRTLLRDQPMLVSPDTQLVRLVPPSVRLIVTINPFATPSEEALDAARRSRMRSLTACVVYLTAPPTITTKTVVSEL